MKKNRPYYKEVIRINKNESTYYSFGDEPEPIEFYYMLVCDNEQKCNTYSNECAIAARAAFMRRFFIYNTNLNKKI